MQVRFGKTKDEINAAIAIDERVINTHDRAKYITAVAERGGLTLAFSQKRAVGFCCCDLNYLFEKPFVSLLIVDERERQLGFGRALLRSVADNHLELWTSTNRSNIAMRNLLQKEGWYYCGQLDGLDLGDPEMFFKTSS